jgi:hypothetical protein
MQQTKPEVRILAQKIADEREVTEYTLDNPNVYQNCEKILDGAYDDPAHGYGIVLKTNALYQLAEKCASKYSYIFDEGIALEEDCDLTKYLKQARKK